ncbi:hypothetical protein [Ruania rhizosphaerae]|uniref:hypothetical protein n=1 Tax=Ruania rhizosphaerae TaxID=1840413 RepID=UPI001357E1B9|nr:hypothetical protein [Ruania rhizosphaerae]
MTAEHARAITARPGVRSAGMGHRGIYVEISIAAPPERVWQLSQDPALHARWAGGRRRADNLADAPATLASLADPKGHHR